MTEEKFFPWIGVISEEDNQYLNRLFARHDFAFMVKFLESKNLWDKQNQIVLLKEAIMADAYKVTELIGDWQLHEEDLKNIAVYGNATCFEAVCWTLENYKLPELAMYLLDRNQFINDIMLKLYVVIKHKAFSDKFWETILKSQYNSLLQEAIQQLNEWKFDVAYKTELKRLEDKIIKHNVSAQIQAIAAYLSIDGWKKLSVPQLTCAIFYQRPPDAYIKYCLFSGKVAEFTVIAEKYMLSDFLLNSILEADLFEMFAVYVKSWRLSNEHERRLFTEKSKKYRREYMKYHRIPWLRRLSYLFD